MNRARLFSLVPGVLLVALCGCLTVQDAGGAGAPDGSPEQTSEATAKRPLAPVIVGMARRGALTPEARALIDEAAGDRISTRIYLTHLVDPTGTFTFDEAAARRHIAQRAPSRQEGCLFVVDLEGQYYKALRRGNSEQVDKAVNLYLQTVRTAKEARPGEPVMVYGLPNRTWRNFDFSVLDPVFREVDYINIGAYGGNDNTEALYRRRIDENFAIARTIADRYGLELVAHVNPRYKDETRVPIDEFITNMQYLKSKGVEHVVYWQPPWDRIKDLEKDGKPRGMSAEAWQAAVEQAYLCALMKVFEPDNPVSKTCSATLPGGRK